MRRYPLLLLLTSLSACDLGTIPAPAPGGAATPSPQATPLDHANSLARADSIYVVALRQVPIEDKQGVTIGVLDRGASATSQLVSYENESEWEIYHFERNSGEWERVQLVESGRFPSATPEDMGFGTASLQGYSGSIAQIANGGTGVDEWFVSNLKNPGYHYMTEGYGAVTIDRAQFFPGSVVEPDSAYEVTFVRWEALRDTWPTTCAESFWTTTSAANFVPGPCFREDINSWDNSTKPQRFSLTYHLQVKAGPRAKIILYEANDSDYKVVSTYVAGGFPWTITDVDWSVSSDGISWQAMGTSCFGERYAGAFRVDNPVPTQSAYFRATVTLSNSWVLEAEPLYSFPWTMDINDASTLGC